MLDKAIGKKITSVSYETFGEGEGLDRVILTFKDGSKAIIEGDPCEYGYYEGIICEYKE